MWLIFQTLTLTFQTGSTVKKMRWNLTNPNLWTNSFENVSKKSPLKRGKPSNAERCLSWWVIHNENIYFLIDILKMWRYRNNTEENNGHSTRGGIFSSKLSNQEVHNLFFLLCGPLKVKKISVNLFMCQ